jgi:phage terminase large subunit-like protein
MESNWTNVIVPTIFQGGRTIALGTRFHFDDLFSTIFTEQKGWKVITQSAIQYDDDGRPKSYWPEMWSTKYLLRLQGDDKVAFSYQYLNQPVRSTELGISPELFIKGEVPDTYDTVGVGIDLSAGMSERNDWTVFTLAGRVDDKIYVIDYRRMRSMGNIEKVEALCELLAEWNLLAVNEEGHYFSSGSPVTIWPEVVAYQKSFEGDLKRILFNEWQLYNISISPVKGFRGDKLARLRGIIGLFEAKKIIFNKYRDFGGMVDEVVNFGHAPHDDCADSLNIVVQGLMRRGGAQVEWN